jgi:DMSO/TMAO reductase YedYZ molybdopterin-dependent catalytic subunit
MKRIWIVIMMLALLLGACATQAAGGEQGALVVGDGENGKSYSLADLQAMPSAEAAFKDVHYLGVPLPALIQEAGYDPQAVKAVKLVASDGYSVNYEPAIFSRQDVIVAYAQTDGPLAEEDGAFRIVLPGGEGKLNLRMLVEVVVIS